MECIPWDQDLGDLKVQGGSVWMGKEACEQGACSEQTLARVDPEKRGPWCSERRAIGFLGSR